MTTTVSTTTISHDSYYAANKNNEPRQKLFAVLRYEKQGSSDSPGWIIKIITQDQRDLIDTLKKRTHWQLFPQLITQKTISCKLVYLVLFYLLI